VYFPSPEIQTLVKLQASGDSTANSTRGRVEEPGAASYKLDRYSIKDYIGYYES